MLSKVQEYIPTTCQQATEQAIQLYGFSKDQAFWLRDTSIGKAKAAQEGLMTSYSDTERYVNKLVQKLTHEILFKVENAIGVEGVDEDVMQLETYRKRLQAILNRILKGYIYYYSNEAYSQGRSFISTSKEFSLPYYISLKATLLVSKDLLMEFLEARFQNMKLSYESSKDMVVMLINGQFDEEYIKQNIFGKFDDVKRLTVSVVQKGLQIKIDRKSLIENFDKFTIKFLDTVKNVKEMGEGNIEEVKKKSRNLYQDVLRKIREKQKQITISMKGPKQLKAE